jgi:hypothetical protein
MHFGFLSCGTAVCVFSPVCCEYYTLCIYSWNCDGTLHCASIMGICVSVKLFYCNIILYTCDLHVQGFGRSCVLLSLFYAPSSLYLVRSICFGAICSLAVWLTVVLAFWRGLTGCLSGSILYNRNNTETQWPQYGTPKRLLFLHKHFVYLRILSLWTWWDPNMHNIYGLICQKAWT